jgi:transcriptional regulator with XRE-family HTH domain
MSKLAQELSWWRAAFGLTQQDAAELLQYSLAQYGRFERGQAVPPYRDLQRVRAHMECMYRGAELERDRGVRW